MSFPISNDNEISEKQYLSLDKFLSSLISTLVRNVFKSASTFVYALAFKVSFYSGLPTTCNVIIPNLIRLTKKMNVYFQFSPFEAKIHFLKFNLFRVDPH